MIVKVRHPLPRSASTMAIMSIHGRRTILLVQLPIPPLGPEPIRGNVPLAPAYLKLFAEKRGLGSFYDIEILPAERANALGDQALVAAIVERSPWLVGFTCYLWNIERVLWIAEEVKRRLPGVRLVLGGPEVTPDNAWLLESASYDYAVTRRAARHRVSSGSRPAWARSSESTALLRLADTDH